MEVTPERPSPPGSRSSYFDLHLGIGRSRALVRTYQVAQLVKNPPASVGDARGVGSILGSGRSPGGGNGNPLQYSCLENPMGRGAWRAAVFGIAESDTPK